MLIDPWDCIYHSCDEVCDDGDWEWVYYCGSAENICDTCELNPRQDGEEECIYAEK